MKEVLVIGGSGFVGSHTCDSLSESGYKVTIFDKLKSQWIKKDQKMIIGDMMDEASLRAAMNNKDYVFHFGGIADIEEADKKPFETVNFNVLGVTKALMACKEAGVKGSFMDPQFMFLVLTVQFIELANKHQRQSLKLSLKSLI